MRLATLLVLVLIALFCSLVSGKFTSSQMKVLQASDRQHGGDSAGDDSVDVKIIRCCIDKFTECEPGFCSKIESEQATLFSALSSKKEVFPIPDGDADIDQEQLAELHEQADVQQLEGMSAFLELTGLTKEELAYRFLWTDGIIPYKWQDNDNNVTPQPATACQNATSDAVKYLFLAAVNEFHKGSCLRWHYDTTAVNAIVVGSSPKKGSATNGLGNVAKRLCIDSAQGSKHMKITTVLHEMGHIAGFAHTHKRSDVATYITFQDANIKRYAQLACKVNSTVDYPASPCMRNWRYQFKVEATEAALTTAGSSYDYKSIMHYPMNLTFSNGGVLQLMVPTPDKYAAQVRANGNRNIIPGTYGLTPHDLDGVNKAYQCIKVTIQGKKGSTAMTDKKAWFGKTHPNAMVKHIIEEVTGLDETTVTVTKEDGTAIGGTLDASGVADTHTIKASTP